VCFWWSIGWLLQLVDFVRYCQRNTQQCSFAQIWTVFHHYFDGNHSTINWIFGICLARFFYCGKYTLFYYWRFYLKMYVYSPFLQFSPKFCNIALSWSVVDVRRDVGRGVGGDVRRGVILKMGQSVGRVVGRGVDGDVDRGARWAMIAGAVSDFVAKCWCCSWGHCGWCS